MIRMIRGAYGHQVGNSVIKKTPEDPPFSLTPEQEARLVDEYKVAEYVAEPELPGEQGGDGPRAYDETMKLAELKEIAIEDYGCDSEEINKLRAKADVIAAIEAKLAEGKEDPDPDGGDDDPEGDGDKTPDPAGGNDEDPDGDGPPEVKAEDPLP